MNGEDMYSEVAARVAVQGTAVAPAYKQCHQRKLSAICLPPSLQIEEGHSVARTAACMYYPAPKIIVFRQHCGACGYAIDWTICACP